MSIYAELAQAARQTELEESIERLHGEVMELRDQLSDALEERNELTSVVDAQAADLKDTGKELDRLSEAITSAIADLRVLGEVPLGELEESIKAIADGLADKNGELY